MVQVAGLEQVKGFSLVLTVRDVQHSQTRVLLLLKINMGILIHPNVAHNTTTMRLSNFQRKCQ